MAQDARELAHHEGCAALKCKNAARWILQTEDDVIYVCRLHANVAERRGELEVK